MVYRETPRIAARRGGSTEWSTTPTHGPGSGGSISCRAERQLDLPRVLLAFCLGVAGLTLIGYLGTQALRSMVHWLHQQPQYQVRFLDIRLQNEPPAWFRGGAQAFLRQVREHVKEDGNPSSHGS